jgi:hypothetical protein
MAKAYKILGQAAPAANTSTDLYTVPSAKEAVISSLVVCNQSTTTGKFRISTRPNGEGLAAKHYVAYDTDIPGNDTVILTLGMTLDAFDVVTVYSYGTSSISYNLYGSEIT